MKQSHHPFPFPFPFSFLGLCTAVLALCGCSGLPTGPSSSGPEAAASGAGRILATPLADGRTAEGGFVDGFVFAEKPGDAAINPVSFTSGAARATGVIEPRHGSSWGGVALSTALARGGRVIDAAPARTLAISLASTGSDTLRVRLVGANATLRDTGCYPVAVVRVAPELKEYAVPIASFVPEPYCAVNAPSGGVVAAALAAVEVADATVAPGRRRQVDFTVGVIRVMP